MAVLSGAARRATMIVVTALALALSACSPAPGTDAAPGFSGARVDGGRFEAPHRPGDRPSSGSGRRGAPSAGRKGPMSRRSPPGFAGRVAFVGVAGLGHVPEMRTFVSDTGTGALTHVVDVDGALWQRFGVVAQPAFAPPSRPP